VKGHCGNAYCRESGEGNKDQVRVAFFRLLLSDAMFFDMCRTLWREESSLWKVEIARSDACVVWGICFLLCIGSGREGCIAT